MKTPFVIFRIQLLFIIIATFNFVNGQIEIQSGSDITPEDMVEYLVGEGIVYSNVTFQGAEQSRGIFNNGQTTNLGLASGIFLTSGAGYIIPGPNNSSSAGTNNNLPGDPSLNNISYHTTYDASVLEFDIFPEFDTMKFKFVFGSEEYENGGVGLIGDIMGIFITGPDPAGGFYNDLNVALVPGTTLPINCINININNNSQYYIDNSNGLTLQYDGFTAIIGVSISVVPCAEYHIKLGVADTGDHIFDSGVFFEESSISALTIETEISPYPPGITEYMVEGHVEADVVFWLPNVDNTPLTVYFENVQGPGFAINGVDYEEIENSIIFEEGLDSVTIHITPLYDGIVEGDEFIELIIENTLGCTVRYDTLVLTILDYGEMASQMSPNLMICPEQEVDLWVNVYNGFPPYTYDWEPGNQTNDTISVSPLETTNYIVTAYDIFQESIVDSTLVTVFPGNQNAIFNFSFEAGNNPQIQQDIIGQISGDSVYLFLPLGTNTENLIASFNLSNCAEAYVDDLLQQSGATPNDFSLPVTYQVTAHNGDVKNWVVMTDEITGSKENRIGKATAFIYPNPSDGEFTIKPESFNANPIEITVRDLAGKIVYSGNCVRANHIRIDFSQQPKGVYFIQFKTGEKVWNEKLVLQ
ncbi:MAG: choice-of-anchor L domain-containing protein [Bacteroidales bacterium]